MRSWIILCTALVVVPSVGQSVGDWPGFRGPGATGIGDGSNPPATWDAEKGINILWRTPIPGLGHSSPVVAGDRVFITSAVSSDPEPYLRVGLYGESPDNPEEYIHHYRIYCLDRKSGKIIWERTAHSGIPQVKRHIKSSHASSTAATNGTHVVVSFGSEGLYCYTVDGKKLWKVDLGFLDSGAFNAPEIQWGFGSSPVIHDGKVVVLCDVNNQSFIAAFDVTTGKQLWKTLREEVPTWGTPTVHKVGDREQIAVNGWKHIGGYDLATGKEIWRLTGGGDVPVPTPFLAHGLIFISNAHGRMRPIYAIRETATGDISLAEGATANEHIAWSLPRRGSYQPTPIVYGDYLYIGSDNGVLTCYEARTGKQLYRERIAGERSAYTASAVAADGKLYYTTEFGDIHVIKAGPEYRHLASNKMGEICMATPALADGMLLVRTSKHLFAIAETDKPLVYPKQAAAEEKADEGGKELAAASKSLPADPSKLTDPVEILRYADTATRAIGAATYDIELVGTGALEPLVGEIKLRSTIQGYAEGLPVHFLIEGTVKPAGAEEVFTIHAGCDGDRYFIVDPTTKTVHADLETSVLGPARQAVFAAFLSQLVDPAPFDQQLRSNGHELIGSKQIGDVDCFEIKVNDEETWYIAKHDLLPRGNQTFYDIDGQKGSLIKLLSKLEADPELPADHFEIKLPEGYSKSEQPLPQ
jgi:outer membrane protein assembly factor BamB